MAIKDDDVLDSLPAAGRGDVRSLGDLALSPSVENAVAAVREFLGMEIAYATEFADGAQRFRVLRGDGASFGMSEGMSVPLEYTYCQSVLDGRLPNLMPDVRGDERSATMPATEVADIGAFATVPITLSDGRLYGTLCAGSHQPAPSLNLRDLQFLHVFARIIADQIEHAQQTERLRVLELQASASSTLITALAARDGYSGEHSQAVVDLAVRVAEHLGLDKAEVQQVHQAALLHDIGKIAIPDAILHKPCALSEEEWKVMRSHPILGEQIALATGGLEALAPVIRAEHERWDGCGYPDGLAGEQIPLASRITFVCDAYNAMTSDRPYRAALSRRVARDRITEGAGTQFCPSSSRALLDLLDGR